MTLLAAGGCGFIGSAVVRHLIGSTAQVVINVDKVTTRRPRMHWKVPDPIGGMLVRADIADADAMRQVFAQYQPDAVMHLAAESHVDRSIDGPAEFVQTKIVDTFVLLEAARGHAAGGAA